MPNLLATRQKRLEASGPIDPGSLAQAFESFTSAAGSLEQSYGLLQAELSRLRRELELRNRELARSLAENQRMRTYLGRILENLPCGVLVVDRNFQLRYANDDARLMLALGSPATPSSALPKTLGTLLEEVAADGPGAERTWSLGDSEDAPSVGVTCAVLAQGVESREELVFILRDTTQQKRLEKEREFSRRMQALAEMTALLAHEIRNPLASLELFAGLVKEATQKEPEVSQWMVHLQAGLRALSATVNNVLHFYSQVPLGTVPIDFVKLLTDTVEFLQPLALQRGMGINFIKPEKEMLIKADPHRLQQVFFNLAINALRAMSAGGTVTVRVNAEQRENGLWADIAFEDEGRGISPENIEKIFAAGFTTNPGSPGLGLTVCKRVIDQHGGTLHVSSVPGRGTTFTLSFPVLGA